MVGADDFWAEIIRGASSSNIVETIRDVAMVEYCTANGVCLDS